MKSFFGSSAVIAATLVASSFILSATPSAAETPLSPVQQQKQELTPVKSETSAPSGTQDQSATSNPASNTSVVTGVVIEATDPASGLTGAGDSQPEPVTAPVHYTATAYSLYGRTASGQRVSKGLIAADPRVLPLGTRVRLDTGSYSGEYLVADTGGAVRGKRIDIWMPSTREAMRFGRRLVKLTVLSYGPKRNAVSRQRSR
jgi:3D (Asp-Asp-Asp) domain-containing protein